MMTPTLVLAPQGGLCNRLRAMLSALSLIDEGRLTAHLTIGWNADDECAARFDQLFMPLADSRITIGPRRWYDRPITRANLHWPALVRRALYTAQYSNCPPSPEALQQHLTAQAAAAVYVSTGQAFCDYSPTYVRRLSLLPHLQQQVDNLCRSFDDHTIGVHIRRTDHTIAIAESPDTLFESAMQNALKADPEAHFYLATDDPELKQHLAARFLGRIVAQQCRGSRADLQGMEEAVVDLWTLARTSRIIGSYWSSFTDTAAELGGIPLTILRK